MVVLSSDATTFKPRVVWLEAGALRSVQLIPSLTAKPTFVQGSVYRKIIDIDLQSKGHFIALKTDDTGRVLKLDAEEGLKVIYDFPDSVSACSELHLCGCSIDGLRQNLINVPSHSISVDSTGLACLTLGVYFGRSV